MQNQKNIIGDYMENKYWFFIERELTEISLKLQKDLNLPEFYRDYEDTWEWCESNGRDHFETNIYFNISREHNWKQGKYECPVLVILRDINKKNDELGQMISNSLGVTTFYGQVEYNRFSVYNYNVLREWTINH